MSLWIRVAGAFLLVAAGFGAGWGGYRRKFRLWWQMHTFARLLSYWQGILAYQMLTGTELLRRAAVYPDFRQLRVEAYGTLSEYAPPEEFPLALRQEVVQGLRRIAGEPRATACDTLGQLARLCEAAAQQAQEEADCARRLYPRLGVCAGVLAVILLW